MNDLCIRYTGKMCPLIWRMLEHHFKGKKEQVVIHFPPLKEKQILDMLFRFWSQDPTLGNPDVAYIVGDSESCQLVIQKSFQGAYMTWQIQASVLDINTVWSLWQTLTESEHKSLRLGNKGILPATQNFTVLKAMPDVLLGPDKTGSVTTGYQVIMQNWEGYCCQPHQVT